MDLSRPYRPCIFATKVTALDPPTTIEQWLNFHMRELTRVSLLYDFKEQIDPYTTKSVDVLAPFNTLLTFLESINQADYETISDYSLKCVVGQLVAIVYLDPFHSEDDIQGQILIKADIKRFEKIKNRFDAMRLASKITQQLNHLKSQHEF